MSTFMNSQDQSLWHAALPFLILRGLTASASLRRWASMGLFSAALTNICSWSLPANWPQNLQRC